MSTKRIAGSAFSLALLVFLARTVVYFTSDDLATYQVQFVFAHLLMLLLGVAVAVNPLKPGHNFALNFRKGLTASAVYALSAAVLSVLFFSLVAPDYFPKMRAALVERELTENTVATRAQIEERINSFFSLFNYTSLTLMTFLATGAIYSAVTSALKSLLSKVNPN